MRLAPLAMSFSIMSVLIGMISQDAFADRNGTWEPYPPPTGRQDALSVYDPVHDRMIVFGGNSGTYPNAIGFGETWSLDLATWTWHYLLPSLGGPGLRYQSTMVYDSTRQRVLLFGGSIQSSGEGTLGDVWSLSMGPGSTWQLLSTAGGPVPARANHVAIYDPSGDRMIIYGGRTPAGTLNDTWQLTLSGTPTWSRFNPTDAPSLEGASAIYDPTLQRMIVFGGIKAGGRRNDVWAFWLNQPSWQLLVGGVGPMARSGHTAIYDPVLNAMIVHGGDASYPLADTWSFYFSANAWFQLTAPNSPPYGRTEHTAIFDTSRNKMVMFGGWLSYAATNEIWMLDPHGNAAWSKIYGWQGVGTPAFFDPIRNRIVAFDYDSHLWARSIMPASSWVQLFPTGTPPPGTSGYSFIYDPVRDRAVLFGGLPVSTVWSLELANGEAWVQLFPSGTVPGTRVNHSAVYDPVRDRMLVFGGTNPNSTGDRNDVWELRFRTNEWRQILASGTPPVPRWGAATVLDPVRDRMLVFAGGTGYNTFLNDLWSLPLQGSPVWSQLPGGTTLPTPRAYASGFYDLSLDRMVVFGGSYKNDLWELNGSTDTWSPLSPGGEVPVVSATGLYDTKERNFYAGSGASIWVLHLGPATTGVYDPALAPVSRVTVSPNPFRGATKIRFSQNKEDFAELTIHDVTGRKVATPLPLTALSAGPHEISWQSNGLGSGVYFFRLQTGSGTQAGRIIVLQ